MSMSILGLALAYVFMLLLVLLAVFRSALGPGLKLTLAALCFGFYLWHYSALQLYPGWPATDELPARFELISSIAVEPDLKKGLDGALYLWLRDLDAEKTVPRAYRLPYQKQLHRKLNDTLRKQQEGGRFVGSPVEGGSDRRTQIEFEAVQRETRAHKSALE